jgi:hypothetical protein
MISYFPVVTGSLTVSGSVNISGGITASGGITISGSIASASYAATASFVALAQSASNAVSAQTASFANTLTVAGNLTAQTLVVQTITSSVDFVTGSTRFGSILGNTHVFSGSVTMNPNGLFVSSSGLVGIGNVIPAYTLDVTGTGRFTGAATFNGTVNVYDGSSRGLSISNSSGAITFSNNWGKTTFTAPSAQDIEFNDDAGVKRLFLKNGGNVGIGTSSPLVLFDVRQPYAKTDTTRRDILYASNESSPSGLRVSIVGGASQAVRSAHLQTTDWGITNDGSIVLQPFGGNVGIGIENPSSILYISAQSDTVGGNGIRLGNSGVNRIWNTRFGTNTDLSYNLDFYDGSTWSNRFKLSYTGAATFFSTISAGAATFSGRAISNGYKSYSGEISIASGVTSTIYTMGDNGLYTVQIIVGGGSLIYSAAAIFYSHSNNGQFVKTIDLYDGANVTLDQSAGAIRITNNGFATLTWNWSIIFQPF